MSKIVNDKIDTQCQQMQNSVAAEETALPSIGTLNEIAAMINESSTKYLNEFRLTSEGNLSVDAIRVKKLLTDFGKDNIIRDMETPQLLQSSSRNDDIKKLSIFLVKYFHRESSAASITINRSLFSEIINYKNASKSQLNSFLLKNGAEVDFAVVDSYIDLNYSNILGIARDLNSTPVAMVIVNTQNIDYLELRNFDPKNLCKEEKIIIIPMNIIGEIISHLPLDNLGATNSIHEMIE